MKSYCIYNSPVGKLIVAADGGGITDLRFGQVPDGAVEQMVQILETAVAQLDEYFAGHRRDFDLPLNTVGTPFQQGVWTELLKIPYGQTRSYGQIAEAVGNPRASRAVGMANNRNPISIIVPCHRVVGANGTLTGYGGGLENKEALLRLEEKHKNG